MKLLILSDIHGNSLSSLVWFECQGRHFRMAHATPSARWLKR
jgi:hypothetical protein